MLTAIATRLYAPDAEIAQALDKLCADGFLKSVDDLYAYDCSEALSQQVDRLEAAYRSLLVPMTNLIHTKSRDIRAFSDGFRFQKRSLNLALVVTAFALLLRRCVASPSQGPTFAVNSTCYSGAPLF